MGGGPGPGGLYPALLLAQETLDVLVLEEDEAVGVPTHCTGLVSGETNRLYKPPEEVVLNRPSACLVVSPAGRVAVLEDPGEEIAVLDRAGFDRALAASVAEAGGAIPTRGRVNHGPACREVVQGTTRSGERRRARAL